MTIGGARAAPTGRRAGLAPPTVEVAICLGPGERPTEGCLSSLARAGARPSVWGPDPGVAHARNAALAACTADVLAFLDPDVEVPPGWLAKLRELWSTAGARLAALGGPIAVRVAGEPPTWLDERLLGVLGAVDHGPEAADLDPAARTLLGGNLSVRAAAARGVGGLWPARGRPGARDWFCAEHPLQRDLGAAGWTVRYDPALAAERVVPAASLTPAGLVRARFAYGARLGAVGNSRAPAEAVRQVVASAAGVPLALAEAAARAEAREEQRCEGARPRGAALALARAARAAENAGVLLAPVAGRPDVQPVGSSPLRGALPAPEPSPAGTAGRWARRALRRARRGALVLLYHRVAERHDDPLGLCVSPGRFAEHLDVLREQEDVVGLADVANLGAGPPGGVAITFDDGYADNLHAAAPALAARGLPGTVFVCTEHVATGRPFFWDEVAALLRSGHADALELALGGETRAWRTGSAVEREAARRHLHAWMQGRAAGDHAALLDPRGAWAGAAAPPGGDRPLTLDELRELAVVPGIEIGSHARRHVSLAQREPDEQRAELAAGRDDLAGWLGAAPAAVAYPFGVPGYDVDAVTLRCAAEAGHRYGVVNRPGVVTRRSVRLALPRAVVPDLDGDAFAAWLRARRLD